MKPRMIHVAMLTTALAASGCAMQTGDPSTEDVGAQSNGLVTGTDDPTPKVDPQGEQGELGGGDPGQLGNPGDPGNPGDKCQGGDPSKPSPDPWNPDPTGKLPVKPGYLDPTVNPTAR